MSKLLDQEKASIAKNVNFAIEHAPVNHALETISSSQLPFELRTDLSSVIKRMPQQFISIDKSDKQILVAAEDTTTALLGLSLLQLNGGKAPQTKNHLTQSLKSLIVTSLTQKGPSKIENAHEIYLASRNLESDGEFSSAERVYNSTLERESEKSLQVKKHYKREVGVILVSFATLVGLPIFIHLFSKNQTDPYTGIFSPFMYLALTGSELKENAVSIVRQTDRLKNLEILSQVSEQSPSAIIEALTHAL